METVDERAGLPSASAWRRYELCPGSFQLEAEARRLNQLAHQGGTAAERGERIHAWLAGVPDEDGNEISLTESEQTTADFLQERAQGEVTRIFGEEQVRQLDEKRLWLTLNGKKVLSGRFDRVLYTPTVALLQDFKTGFSEPDPAEQNAQLKVLSVLVALSLPTVKEVVAQIVSGPHGITEARYDREALKDAWDSIVATLKAVHAIDAPLKPGVEQCRYCPANLICQATKNLILPMATKTQVSRLPTGERAAKLLDECELISLYIDEIRAYYRRSIEADPNAVPGWDLEQGAPRRAVKDWLAARQKLEEFIDGTKFDALADYSIPAVEKLLGETIGVRGAKLKEQFASILGELLEQKFPAPSLKRTSGKARLAEVTLP